MQAQNTICLDYLHPDTVYGAEFILIFPISRTFFEQMMMEVMTHHGLEFYQDLHGHPSLTRCSLWGMLLYPLKTLAYGMHISCYLIIFKFPFNLEWNCAESLIVWFKIYTQRNICEFLMRWTFVISINCNAMLIEWMVCWFPFILTHNLESCPKTWAGYYQGKENYPQLCWRVFLIMTCFCHASYWYAGALRNDTIFGLSPFQ